MLLMLLGAIVAARERENQRVVTLQVTEPAHGVRMVGKLVVGEHCARRDVRTHRLDSFVAVTRIGLGRAPAMVTSHWALRWCFDVVVDACRSQPPVRAALVNCDAGLRWLNMAAPADAVVLHGAAHTVVGHDAMLQADTASCAEAPREERAQLTGAAVDVGRA